MAAKIRQTGDLGLTRQTIKPSKAQLRLNGEGEHVASAREVVLDRQFLDTIRGREVLVELDSRLEHGVYRIDREQGRLVKVDASAVNKLEWHEKLIVSESAANSFGTERLFTLWANDSAAEGIGGLDKKGALVLGIPARAGAGNLEQVVLHTNGNGHMEIEGQEALRSAARPAE